MREKPLEIIIVGTGTAGLIAAAMLKRNYEDKINVSIYYRADQKNIGVGEGTFPSFVNFVYRDLGLTPKQFIKRFNSSLKLGINFKNWIPETEFFHGFFETTTLNSPKIRNFYEGYTNFPSSTYSLIHDRYEGGYLFNKATTTIPDDKNLNFGFGFHVDSQDFSNNVTEIISKKVKFIDDNVEKVFTKDGKIDGILFKNSGLKKADFYIDASGFKKLLIKELSPSWIDITNILPVNRAIPQQVKNDGEVPSYTLSEATDCGWIWQIPVRTRYGTGFIYSSNFTSDEEAKHKFDKWLTVNHKTNLVNDQVIKFDPGYYKTPWIENCLAVGLSCGFLEPLEATGIALITQQMDLFFMVNQTFNCPKMVIDRYNKLVTEYFEECLNLVRLHYNTGRRDSEFWRYLDNNKTDYVNNLIDICSKESIVKNIFSSVSLFSIDSFIAVLYGLNMIKKEPIINHIKQLPNSYSILKNMAILNKKLVDHRKSIKFTSHKDFLLSIVNS